MKTLILHHDDCLQHHPGDRHPERASRVKSVLKALRNMKGTEMLPAPKASMKQIGRVHLGDYWQRLIELEPRGDEPGADRLALDPDTFLSPGSISAAMRGSGAACFAIDQVFAGKSKNAFCAVRPPGHHAAEGRAMGFCLLNHVAIGARHALATHGIDRVAILDFDVHHGNGTQTIFSQSPQVQYVSSHQIPLYPGTGNAGETGCGNILNLPLAPGAGSREFRAAWSGRGLPALHDFKPELIIISAGFDAHQQDPLGQIELQDDDFGWITSEICNHARTACGGRVISVLEGGYDLDALASSAHAHVEAMTK